jgi:hypothetical protein
MLLLSQAVCGFLAFVQERLFPAVEEAIGPLTEKMAEFVRCLEVVRFEEFLPFPGGVGRPPAERVFLARAFLAKAIFNVATTRMLLDRLGYDAVLRRICGWERRSGVPSEATFSRAFAEFSRDGLMDSVHQRLNATYWQGRLVGHVSRDSTAIESRERPHVPKKAEEEQEEQSKRRPGRPKKGEEKEPTLTRLERQATLETVEAMTEGIPRHCDRGVKRNADGIKRAWVGYKLHIDVGDGDIPLSGLLTAASVHDSQVALPLSRMTADRCTSLYDLMDSAYDAQVIRAYSQSLGHVPIIDSNPRTSAAKEAKEQEALARTTLNLTYPEEVRYNQRTSSERVNSSLKDNYGGRHVRVRGHVKVFCHLLFGLVALTVAQMLRSG